MPGRYCPLSVVISKGTPRPSIAVVENAGVITWGFANDRLTEVIDVSYPKEVRKSARASKTNTV